MADAEGQAPVPAPWTVRIRKPESFQILIFLAGFRTIYNFGLCNNTGSEIPVHAKKDLFSTYQFPRKHIYLGKPLKQFSEILTRKLEKFKNTECQLLKINNFLQVPKSSPFSFSFPKSRHQNTYENLGLNDGRQRELVTQCTPVP